MIPQFNEDGNLPPGVHRATWDEVAARFARSDYRRAFLPGLREVMRLLQAAGCRTLYLDGSFVTRKWQPRDFDACWDEAGVDFEALDPIFLGFESRAAQKKRFGGEAFPVSTVLGPLGHDALDFFQICRRTGHRKGIIALDLTQWQDEDSP